MQGRHRPEADLDIKMIEMHEKRQRRSFAKAALIQIAAAVLAVAIWFCFRTEAYLANPLDGDLYAHSWGFQSLVFSLIWLPLALFSAGVLICVEWAVLRLCVFLTKAPTTSAAGFR